MVHWNSVGSGVGAIEIIGSGVGALLASNLHRPLKSPRHSQLHVEFIALTHVDSFVYSWHNTEQFPEKFPRLLP